MYIRRYLRLVLITITERFIQQILTVLNNVDYFPIFNTEFIRMNTAVDAEIMAYEVIGLSIKVESCAVLMSKLFQRPVLVLIETKNENCAHFLIGGNAYGPSVLL